MYKGNKLPPFYIGSTSVKNLENGYTGSVCSKRYKLAWKFELKENPHLFKTLKLTKTYAQRIEAMEVEKRLQVALKVVKSNMYVNQAVAIKNGFFGRDTSGKNHPLFGRARTQIEKIRISANHADVSGIKNGRAKIFKFTSPEGIETLTRGAFKEFCSKNNLPLCCMGHISKGRIFTSGKCVGWKCELVK